jgi:hypothetical protein
VRQKPDAEALDKYDRNRCIAVDRFSAAKGSNGGRPATAERTNLALYSRQSDCAARQLISAAGPVCSATSSHRVQAASGLLIQLSHMQALVRE